MTATFTCFVYFSGSDESDKFPFFLLFPKHIYHSSCSLYNKIVQGIKRAIVINPKKGGGSTLSLFVKNRTGSNSTSKFTNIRSFVWHHFEVHPMFS